MRVCLTLIALLTGHIRQAPPSRRQLRLQTRQLLPTHIQARWPAPYLIWKRTIRLSIEQPSSLRFANASPLFKKEFSPRRFALCLDAPDPIGGHRTRSWTALAANNDPINPPQVHRS